MACTIDAAVGGENANSFASIADADTYHETHPYADTWTNASEDEKCRALQTATRLLDRWYEWNGHVSSTGQRLLWPRRAVTGRNGFLVPSDELPEDIVHGTAELARQVLDADRTADSDVERQGLRALKAGSVELDFAGTASANPIPDAVHA